ncbi:uncharacterized protein A1O9_00803 [Exophiala aquamarina CBS 119918]|uniref:RecQ-mediated genome instability protein 1 n=1 Tax=Exophiala aquamarina CBS 119918 TaxID=1182545 RepID=A0A072Q4L3_9EURO|nr:uncharacterized protein A1O9_00803 [Exophiala aquamarina CBS 119918]KEF62830.1 hypothetical protein A1O9_00803 [Exophiala aquamarina CBS 119918]
MNNQTTNNTAGMQAQLSASLLSRHNLSVSPAWLADFLSSSSRGPNAPLLALTSTAQFRVLASDIRNSLAPPAPENLLPEGVADVNVKERRLKGAVVVQVLDVIDIGSSMWSQVEAIERVERGEKIRGREVIRSVGGAGGGEDSGGAGGPTAASMSATGDKKLTSGPHKLLVQDAKGTQVLAFELVKIPKIALSNPASVAAPPAAANAAGNPPQQSLQVVDDPGMFIGCKLLLKPGTVVRRGVVMLTPEDSAVLGGKVEAWDRKWKAERKDRLTALIAEGDGAGAGPGGLG